jgi:multidrug transporter EmrE-like cation transporter
MLNLIPIGFGIVMAVIDMIMMSLVKQTSLKKLAAGFGLPIAAAVYALEPFVFFKSLKYESMTVMNLIWDLTSDILVTLMGIFWFQEQVKGLRILAMGFAFLSIGLFAYTGDN